MTSFLSNAVGMQTLCFVSDKYLHSLHFVLPSNSEVLIIQLQSVAVITKSRKKAKRERTHLGRDKEKSIYSQRFGSSPYLPISQNGHLLT